MKSRILNIFVSLLVFSLISIPVHEWCHYWVCEWLGGEANVTYPTMISGHYEYYGTVSNEMAVMFAGGLGTFLFFSMLWALARWTPTRWDLDDEFAVCLTGVTQLGYAFCEGFDISAGMVISSVMGFTSIVVIAAYASSLIDFARRGK